MLLQVVFQLGAEIDVGSLLLLEGRSCLASLLVRAYDGHRLHEIQSCIDRITPHALFFDNKGAGEGGDEA